VEPMRSLVLASRRIQWRCRNCPATATHVAVVRSVTKTAVIRTMRRALCLSHAAAWADRHKLVLPVPKEVS